MAQAQNGDTVRVHYTGRLDDGEVFDSSECEDDGCGCSTGPMEFTIGKGEMIPGFETAIVGMATGETRQVTIPMDEAYGPYMEEMVGLVEKDKLPEGFEPELGAQLEVTSDEGESFTVIITEINDEGVVLDANHPLAGRDLTFDITLVEIV